MKSKSKILESFAEAYELDGLPPLAGKVMGLFYLSDKKYFSFDEIIEQVKASKGAVSKSLKVLINLNRISYKLSPQYIRKRLFYLDTIGIRHSINMVISNYKKQDLLLKACLELRTNENLELNEFIENSIAFNADVLAVIEEKMNKYFNK